MPLFDALLKPTLDSVTSIIGEFHMSPEDKAKAQLALVEATAKAQQVAAEYDMKLNEVAGQNIQADATSGDKFTERARPSFLYLVLAVLGFNFIILPLLKVFGSHVEPVELPSNVLTLFGVALCGYGFSRTAEKIASLPGDSQISVLGLKVGNKQ